MNNKIQIFKNQDFGQVRALEISGEPYFVGKDVAEVLGYQNGSRDIMKHIHLFLRTLLYCIIKFFHICFLAFSIL